jgi:SAM-dependent methyltransferase
MDAVSIQRSYYAKTASAYDDMHVSGLDEHFFALAWLTLLIKLQKFDSLLDVGCGTGRCLTFLKEESLQIALTGIEPVPELRAVAKQKGLKDTEVVDGDAMALPFAEKSIDVVCAFGVLHHIKDHKKAVAEMCRVARRAVFISDANNFGQGSRITRAVKQGLRAFGLWRPFDFIRTKGKGYHYSEGDGVFYSYSIFDDLPTLRRRFRDLRFMSTQPSGTNLYRTASHIAVFAQTSID